MRAGVAVAISLIGIFLFAAGAQAQDAASLIGQAEQFWLARSSPGPNVAEANRLLEQAAAADPKNETAFANLARNNYFLGRFAPKGKKEAYFLAGLEAAKKALAAKPGGVAGHYWYVVCLAKSLEDKGVTTKMKHMSEIKSHMEAAINADPKYYFGGPYRVAGMISFKSPLASNNSAIDLLKKSLAIAPDYSLTLLNLAEVLIKEKKYDEAGPLCRKILTLSPMPGFERELADDKESAKKLLETIPK